MGRRAGLCEKLLSVTVSIRMVIEYRVDDEHHGCATSGRPSPAWITALQPDVEAGVNVEMDARPFVQSRSYGLGH